MHIELFRDDNIPITLSAASAGRSQDILLKGGLLQSHQSAFGSLFLQTYETASCLLHYGNAQAYMGHQLNFRECDGGIRLIGVMKQALKFQEKTTFTIKAGQFIVLPCREQTVRLFFEKEKAYRVLSCYYSHDILSRLGLAPGSIRHKEKPCAFTPAMTEIILEMFSAYYETELLNFFYENKIRELLFMALAYKRSIPAYTYSDEDIDTIYAINSMITNNYSEHFSIQAISRQYGMNEFKLKKGFKDIIGTGLFEKLLDTRLDRAKQLLQTTGLPEKEVARLTGYSSLTSFITAFRKRAGATPREFRIRNK
ncbi:MAG TPA: AraC family transcriptional regulator [Agriterribacter sp.]|nr:AraC family transcriptional regulator [Agriterribacter sp.]HRQ49438.1 AraC family transcriptional regulator [Agriterribacter sp.]